MPLTCPSCGASPDPRDLFCGTCGHPVRNHAAQAAGSAASANGRAQWPGWGTSRTSYAASADQPDQRTNPQRPVREYRQVSRDVPEPRGTHDGRPAEAFAAADGSTRMRVTIPRDQAESGVAAADPQSYITADDRRTGYAGLGVSGTVDPLFNSRFFRQLARRFALYFVVSNVIGFALLLLAFLATYAGGGIAAVENGRGAFTAVGLINLLITATLMAMFLFMPVPALLGQWSRMLTFQAPAAGSALDYARQARTGMPPRTTLSGCAPYPRPAKGAASISSCAAGTSPGTSPASRTAVTFTSGGPSGSTSRRPGFSSRA